MDTILPTWSRPHSFWLLASDEAPIEQPAVAFTFGLVLPELRTLGTATGVALFGRRWGFGWLATLAESLSARDRSTLGSYLRDELGIEEPKTITFPRMTGDIAGATVPADVIDEFAATDGKRIRSWALNALNLLDVTIYEHATKHERVAQGHEWKARALLEALGMTHGLENVHDRQGRSRWAYVYRSLLERIALEFEDLTVRRPPVR